LVLLEQFDSIENCIALEFAMKIELNYSSRVQSLNWIQLYKRV